MISYVVSQYMLLTQTYKYLKQNLDHIWTIGGQGIWELCYFICPVSVS